MSDIVISVENLSKKYLLSHLADKREQLFSRLLVNKAKSAGSRVLDMFRSAGVGGGDQTTEEFWALKDVSFEIKQGDRVGIIGRNGAGKSTLLKILSRITEPTKGRITIDGRVASLLEVGTGFHSELTGRENIYLNGAILGMSREEIKRKFDEIVAFAEVERFLDTPVKRYSSGMYVRLAFAVAAHLEPEILIVDEVLAVGDASFQKKCLGKMEDVSTKEGRTVLFVSHNMQAIKNLCSRTILLNKGEVISDATTDKALMLYTELTRDITVDSETGINDAKVRRGEGAIRFTSVEMLDVHDIKQTSFEMGETVRFKMTYKVFKEMNGVTVHVELRSGITREFITSVKHVVTTEKVAPGTRGKIVVELPDIYIRPGHYPVYLHLSDNDISSNTIDVLDDLTAPLIVTADDKVQHANFDPTRPAGCFSLPSRLVLNEFDS